MSERADVAVVGGGVVGLSIAYVLAAEGVDVAVFDRGPLGRCSSWAGAGMLAPPCARPPADPLDALRDLSVRLHAEWSAALRELTGQDNGYRRSGGLEVALTPAEALELDDRLMRWRDAGIACEVVGAADRARLEPALSPEVIAAVSLPGKAQLRNPWHIRALATGCQARGVRLHPGRGARQLVVERGRLRAVDTAEGRVACGQAVIAAGAWSEQVLAQVGARVPTPPVKGQIVLLHAGEQAPRRIIEHGACYLVPRDEGRVLVGSTEEHVGFDARSTPQAVRDLLEEAIRLCPGLAGVAFETAWAGLRPGSIDSHPTLGAIETIPGLFVATGHKRAGLQLSTGTAVVLGDLLLGREPRISLEPFRVDRPADTQAPLFRS